MTVPTLFSIVHTLLLAIFVISACLAAVPSNNNNNGQPQSGLAFRVGTLLSQQSGQGQQQPANREEMQQQAAEEEADCQLQLAARLHTQMVQQTQLDLTKNLLAQLAPPERRQQVCGIYSAHSPALNDCLRRRSKESPALSPFILLLQTVCRQFHESLEANGVCLADLALARLETECTDACQRQARSQPAASSSSLDSYTPSGAASALCQLGTCSIHCVGVQMSECAEETADHHQQQRRQGSPAANGQQLRALAEQIAGLQMLLAVQQQIQPFKRATEFAQKQLPSECAQLVGRSVYTSQFVANHEAIPAEQQQQQI